MARISKPKLPSEPRKKPGPKPWASEPQECKLLEGVPGYRQAQAKKPKRNAISAFLDDFMLTWWAVFPLKEGVTAAADRAQVRQWFQNHGSAKKTAGGVSVRDIFPRNSRALKAEELYSRKYYNARVKHLVEDKKEEGSTQGQILNLVKATTKEVFAQESEEIREEILMEVKNQPPIKPTTVGEEMTPEMFAAALKSAPGRIKEFLNIVSEATGCALLCILGGPDPWEGGKICSYGFHAGQDQHGRTFGQAFPNFRETYLQPFTRFLKKAYPAEVRAARSLKDFSPAEKALAETERTDASVDVDKDAIDGSDGREPANVLDKDVITEGRAEPSDLGVGGLPDDVDGILRANAGRQKDVVEPPPTELEPEQHEQDHEDRQPAPIPSVRSSPALRLSPPIAKEPTQESIEESNPESQSPATKATSTSANADLLDNDKSTEDERMTAVKVKKVKPRPKPIKRPAANSTLAGTREKRTRTGPAPKEILTLAERAKQGGSVPLLSAARKGRKSA